jgi:hypothetical protein
LFEIDGFTVSPPVNQMPVCKRGQKPGSARSFKQQITGSQAGPDAQEASNISSGEKAELDMAVANSYTPGAAGRRMLLSFWQVLRTCAAIAAAGSPHKKQIAPITTRTMTKFPKPRCADSPNAKRHGVLDGRTVAARPGDAR